jgi:hypothetical protein
MHRLAVLDLHDDTSDCWFADAKLKPTASTLRPSGVDPRGTSGGAHIPSSCLSYWGQPDVSVILGSQTVRQMLGRKARRQVDVPRRRTDCGRPSSQSKP